MWFKSCTTVTAIVNVFASNWFLLLLLSVSKCTGLCCNENLTNNHCEVRSPLHTHYVEHPKTSTPSFTSHTYTAHFIITCLVTLQSWGSSSHNSNFLLSQNYWLLGLWTSCFLFYTNSVTCSPEANYTDWATAVRRWS